MVTTQFSSMNLSMNIDILNGLKNIKQLHLANLSILANQYQLADMKEKYFTFSCQFFFTNSI